MEGCFAFEVLRSFSGVYMGESFGGRRDSCLRRPGLFNVIRGGEMDRAGLMMVVARREVRI